LATQPAAFVLRPEPSLRLVRAPNPSAMTGTGTNSYIVGSGRVAVIDPGPDNPAHLAALLAALDPGERVAQIIVTHAHVDHSALARRLAEVTGAPVLAFDAPARMDAPDLAGIDALDRRLSDQEVVTGDDWALRVLHTPGHLHDHLCLAWGDLCFTGDHVMGWSTSLVSPPQGEMGAFMRSLELLARNPWRRFLPGHGEPVEDPAARLAELAAHRRRREAQILDCLRSGPHTPRSLTAAVYHDTPARLYGAAERNVLAHLLDLQARNLVTADPGSALTSRYSLT